MINELLFIITLFSTSIADFSCLSRNIYFEGRGEPYIGQVAIARVTVNRVTSNKFPNTICEVVSQEKQFSWFSTHRNKPMLDIVAKAKARKIANEVILGRYNNLFNDVLFYHNTSVQPSWARNLNKTNTVNNHIFYKYKEK